MKTVKKRSKKKSIRKSFEAKKIAGQHYSDEKGMSFEDGSEEGISLERR